MDQANAVLRVCGNCRCLPFRLVDRQFCIRVTIPNAVALTAIFERAFKRSAVDRYGNICICRVLNCDRRRRGGNFDSGALQSLCFAALADRYSCVWRKLQCNILIDAETGLTANDEAAAIDFGCRLTVDARHKGAAAPRHMLSIIIRCVCSERSAERRDRTAQKLQCIIRRRSGREIAIIKTSISFRIVSLEYPIQYPSVSAADKDTVPQCRRVKAIINE